MDPYISCFPISLYLLHLRSTFVLFLYLHPTHTILLFITTFYLFGILFYCLVCSYTFSIRFACLSNDKSVSFSDIGFNFMQLQLGHS
jgi:hypothetical protein